MKTILSLLLLCAIGRPALAQPQPDSAKKQGVKFKLSANYNSNLNYYGRTDSLRSSAFFPVAELWVTPTIYVNAAPIFVSNPLQRYAYAGTVATAGYLKVGAKRVTSAYVALPVYKDASDLPQSALKVQSGLSFTFLNKWINLTTGVDAKLSDKLDFGAMAGLDHAFRWRTARGRVWVVDPTVSVQASSQNFQRSYYEKAAVGLPLLGSQRSLTEEVSRFKVLAYEASLPLIYTKANWLIMATPSYIVPQNLVVVEGRPALSERGENTFYATLTAKYSF